MAETAAANVKESVYEGKPLSRLGRTVKRPQLRGPTGGRGGPGEDGRRRQAGDGSLLTALGDPDDSVRDTAAETLSLFGKPVVGPLIAALQSPDLQVRRGAARALSHMGADADDAVGPLIVALKEDGDPDVRETAVYALAAIGSPAKNAIGPLTAVAVGRSVDLHGPGSDGAGRHRHSRRAFPREAPGRRRLLMCA